MADPGDPRPRPRAAAPPSGDEPPRYTKYRARPRLRRDAQDAAGLEGLRRDGPGRTGPADAPARPGSARPAGPGAPADPDGPRRVHGRRRPRLGGLPRRGRILKWLVLAVIGWTVLAALAFVVSATLHQTDVDGALDPGGLPPFSPTTVLVLGSDARPKSSQEPGAGGASRADSMLLIRIGGGHNAKLSIPRDVVADIPGHGAQKINASYAFGGAALAVETVKAFLGIEINHVVEVSFTSFPDLIDAMGGVDYTGGCVVSRINGGFKNGGYTLRLKKGTTHIDGKQALALARTRKNDCNPSENDLTRARRQQKLLGAMKSRVASPSGWLRGPFIGWNAPKSLASDMSGPTLLGLAAAMGTAKAAPTEVLKPTGAVTLPDGGAGLAVSPAGRQAAARRFLTR